MIKKSVSYDNIAFMVDQLAERVKIDYDYIIGIGRGGLIPATMLGYKLNKKVLTFGVNTYNDQVQEDNFVIYQQPEILKSKSSYLVVDDICVVFLKVFAEEAEVRVDKNIAAKF